MIYNIAIDGPAGAGKSTIARQLAEKMGFVYVDTGAMYRAMALYLMRNSIKEDEHEKMEQACKEVSISLAYSDGQQQVLLNGENVSSLIRTEEVGKMTSASSKNPAIRAMMTKLQKQLAQEKSVIMDGRDIGTSVLPDAFLKIYLTADSRERAGRRYKELTEKGVACNLDEIEADIIARDEQDMNREISPLKQADDAVLVDSSDMTIEEVIAKIISLAN